MAALLNPLRRAYHKWFEGPIRDSTAATVGALTPEFAELRRILGDQGDAADQVAEAVGRVLARLSGEVETLSDEVAHLQERLDRLEALR